MRCFFIRDKISVYSRTFLQNCKINQDILLNGFFIIWMYMHFVQTLIHAHNSFRPYAYLLVWWHRFTSNIYVNTGVV